MPSTLSQHISVSRNTSLEGRRDIVARQTHFWKLVTIIKQSITPHDDGDDDEDDATATMQPLSTSASKFHFLSFTTTRPSIIFIGELEEFARSNYIRYGEEI